MKLKLKTFVIVTAVVACSAAAFAGLPALRSMMLPVDTKEALAISDKKPDKKTIAILSELSGVLHRMDSVNLFTMSGDINVVDMGDSSNSMQAAFYFQKDGPVSYYRLGESESVSLKDMYITVDHAIKKIFLSAPVEAENVLQPAGLNITALAKEGYEVSRSTEAGLGQIKLTCPNHVSCREFRMVFDSTGPAKQVFSRLTDPSAPLERNADKLVTTNVSNWQKHISRPELFKKIRYVVLQEEEYKAAAGMEDYEVVVSL